MHVQVARDRQHRHLLGRRDHPDQDHRLRQDMVGVELRVVVGAEEEDGKRAGHGLSAGFCGDGDSKMSVGEGVGTLTTWPADSIANCAAGRKYARPPATDDRAMASKTRKLVRSGLSRRREALMRCPGLRPRGTGEHSRRWGGVAL